MMHLYSAGHARPLAARLADVLAPAPADPMDPEWMAVPSDGMRRWLTLELATHLGASGPGAGDGVAANIARAYPGTLRSCVLAADRGPDEPDPWSIEGWCGRCWASPTETPTPPPCSPFIDLAPGASRYASARRIADLFDRYHLHRPDMIRAVGRRRPRRRSRSARSPTMPPGSRTCGRWCASAIGEPSPPERLPGAPRRRLRRGDGRLDLPSRLVLFGFTLAARAAASSTWPGPSPQHRDVHLFMLEPTHLDSDGLLQLSPAPARGGPRSRSNDATAALVEPPLLRSWGRLHRETALLLADDEAQGIPQAAAGGAVHTVDASTVLGRLQHDIRVNARPARPWPSTRTTVPSSSTPATGPPDRSRYCETPCSICWPRSRASPKTTSWCSARLSTGSPRLIEAVVRAAPRSHRPGRGASSVRRRALAGAPSLRYRIADQSIRSSNPVVRATTRLARTGDRALRGVCRAGLPLAGSGPGAVPIR